MIDYKEYEKSVYDWLMNKNRLNPEFTFSLRQNGSTGAELDYFIGTEKSRYFGTTFWTIPVGFPGSSGDCIDVIFKLSPDYKTYSYNFEFTQTNSPEGTQNHSVLRLIESLEEPLEQAVGNSYVSSKEKRMFTIKTKPGKIQYESLEDMLGDIERDIKLVIPIVDKAIENENLINSEFKAHRITKKKFQEMKDKLELRFARYSDIQHKIMEAKAKEEAELRGAKEVESEPLNQILYGPPGTGKTFNTVNTAIKIIDPYFDLRQDRNTVKAKYDELVRNGQIVFTTFHQSLNYEDFIEGIKPETINDQVTYSVKDGIFKQICEAAKVRRSSNFDDAYQNMTSDIIASEEDYLVLISKTGKEFRVDVNSNQNLNLYTSDRINKQGVFTKEKLFKYFNNLPSFNGWEGYAEGVISYMSSVYGLSHDIEDNHQKNYVLIIDEINRGNVSQVFGELITLIEDDKRLGRDESLELKLPYSNDIFGVPSNLHIIGTMNTADRSVEALDTALRRRFSFKEMMPVPQLIKYAGKSGMVGGFVGSVDLEKVLITLNKRIEKLIDRDHKIGHSYFLSVDSLQTLKNTFQNNIIPLLQEYFYGDYGKIGLVLGEGFFQSTVEEVDVFAEFSINEYNAEGLEERNVFHLLNPLEIEDEKFLDAIHLLLGN